MRAGGNWDSGLKIEVKFSAPRNQIESKRDGEAEIFPLRIYCLVKQNFTKLIESGKSVFHLSSRRAKNVGAPVLRY